MYLCMYMFIFICTWKVLKLFTDFKIQGAVVLCPKQLCLKIRKPHLEGFSSVEHLSVIQHVKREKKNGNMGFNYDFIPD